MAEEVKPVQAPKVSGEYRAIDSRYRRDVALVNARPKLETAALVLWAALDIALILTFVFGVLFYIVSGAFRDARTSASILNNVAASHAGVVREAPDGLDIQEAKSASVTSGKYDLYVTVENFNDDWYTTFDYVFEYDGGVTEIYQGFLNPNEKRLLTAINISAERRPSGIRVSLQNQVWHRVDKHAIPNTAQFLSDRSNITVDLASYSKDVVVGEEQLGRSTIVLTNRTAYSYWSPEFLVKLMRGSTVVSLTKIVVPEFTSNETRELEVRWFGEVPPSGTISIEPLIFYFDDGVYMDPDDEKGRDVRR
jgi:hypothetical protein